MAFDQSPVFGLLAQLKLTDVAEPIRSAAETLCQGLIDSEATALIGAALFERCGEQTAPRNGTRPQAITNTAGDLDKRISKLSAGSIFPALLEHRHRVDQGLFEFVVEGLPPRRLKPQGR